MLLHRLKITAFGPFAGTEDIDMDALTASGLFLLEGPTGAGKSTVLDAITFALYGQAASADSSADRLRSHFAAPDVTPQVVLELSVRGQRLRITRVPEHERPKLRGEGTTKEKARVHLERLDAGAWSSVSSHVQEVAHVLEDVVGLNREQFTKVVLLPQGEFATFLRADDDVRRKLLTKVFGTGLYDQVTDELDRRRREAGRQRDEAERRLSDAVAAAAEAAALDADEAEELCALTAGDRPARLAEIAADLRDDADAASRAQTVALAALEAATVRAAEAARTAELHDELVRASTALDAHRRTEPARTAQAAELRAALACAPVGVLITQADSAEAQRADALARLLDLDPGASEAQRRGEGAAAHLDASRQADAAAEQLAHLVLLEQALAQAQARADILRDAHGSAVALRSETELARDRHPEALAAAEAEYAAARLLAAGLAAAEAEVERLAAQAQAAVELARLMPRLAQVTTAHEHAADQRLRLHERWNDQRERHLDGIAAELAVALVSGEPCLVCGGVDHPHPASGSAGRVTADDVALAESDLRFAEAELESLQVELESLRVACADLKARAGSTAPADLAVALDARVADRDAAEAAAGRLDDLAAEVERLRTEARTLEDAVQRACEVEARAQAEHEAALASLALDAGTVEQARAGHPTVLDRQRALREYAAGERDLAAAVTALAAAGSSHESAAQAAAAAAAAAGFDDVDAARAAVRTPEQVQALQHAVADWDHALVRLAAAVDDPRLAGLDARHAVAAREAVAGCTLALSAARTAYDAAAEAVTLAEGRVERFARACSAVERLEAAHAAVVADTAAVHRLAGLARGMSGSMRMSLTTYVLRRWFEQVVEAANVRLAGMSAGRYELERTDEAERRAERSGLALRVVDRHTGEARSPKSLSGGETFYTSLALALGLADVVKAEAGGVDLDTLFIDEGFGTLDPETLEQVMSVIDDLREGGRAVGIVSHVAELKDRITERLEVSRPHPQGPSRTRVVA